MQTTTLPEIAASDLKTVREFLTSFRDEERAARTPSSPLGPIGPRSAVPMRNGIARARSRHVDKTGA